MGALYIGIILTIRVYQSFFNKKTSALMPKNALAFSKYTLFTMSFAAVLSSLVWAFGVINKPPPGLVLDGVLYAAGAGISIVLSSAAQLYAMKNGTMALTLLFSTAGLIVPVIAGIFMFGEKINYVQFIGLAIFLFSAYLLILGTKKIKVDFKPATLFLLLLAMLSTGTIMLFQKMFSRAVPASGVLYFSFFTFLPVAVLFGIVVLVWTTVTRKTKRQARSAHIAAAVPNGAIRDGGDESEKTDGNGESETPDGGENKKNASLPKKLYVYGAILSSAVFFINQLVTLAAPIVSSIVLFGLINGGFTVISFVVGAIFFEERINLKNLAGIILGVGSLIMLNVTF
jgi:drug/metabolite transporter (DMT)-like permease